MSKQYYSPIANLPYDEWLQNLDLKAPNYAAKYGLTPDELKDLTNYAADFHYRLDASNKVDAYNQQWTAYRNALRYGLPQGSTVQPPVAPTLSPFAPAAAPGGMARVANMVTKIKTNPAYSVSDGKDLGIEGAEIIIDPNTLQPTIKAFAATGGKPGFHWTKGHTEGIEIHKSDGSGYKKYDHDTHPNYEDKAPLPEQPGVWKYKCIYLFHGEPIGQWSNELTFNVGG